MATPAPQPEGEMRLIARAAAILRALADQPEGASLGDLARATGLARSTVQRVVNALAAERLVAAGANGARLGLEIARLAAFVQSDARARLRVVAEELMRRVQETVDVSALDGDRAVVLEQFVSPQSLRVVSAVGRPLPLHATASGKAHLGALDPAQRPPLLAGGLASLTPRTQVAAEALLAEIEASAQRGLYVDEEEYETGVCALAIAAPTAAEENFALAISMPASRFAARRDAYAGALREAQAKLRAR